MGRLFTIPILLTLFAYPIFANLHQATADYICNICQKKKRNRLAIFNFTDIDGAENSLTAKHTAKVLARLISCRSITLIDKSKLKKVAKEQELGKSGFVDETTAPEIGKVIGAQALLFGTIVDQNSLQVRIVDAESGEILGASLKENMSEAPEIELNTQSQPEIKRDFEQAQLRRLLMRGAKKNPALFMYITATESEWQLLKQNLPKPASRIERLFSKVPEKNKMKLLKFHKKILTLRQADSEADQHIRRMRARILEKVKNKRRKAKNDY